MTLETAKGATQRHHELTARVKSESPALANTLAKENFTVNRLPRAEHLALQGRGQQDRLDKLITQIATSVGEKKLEFEQQKARVIWDMTVRIPLKLMNLGFLITNAAQGLVALGSSIISDINRGWSNFTAGFRNQNKMNDFDSGGPAARTAEYTGGSYISSIGVATLTGLRNQIRSWMGTPYKLGGTSKAGVDCSHFVNQMLRRFFPGSKIPWEGASVLAENNPFGLDQIAPSEMSAHKFGIWAWSRQPGKKHGHTGFFVLSPSGRIELYDASSDHKSVTLRKDSDRYIQHILRRGGKFYSLTTPGQRLTINLNGSGQTDVS